MNDDSKPIKTCPLCGRGNVAAADSDSWWCGNCQKTFPTLAYTCAHPGCFEFEADGRFCEIHSAERAATASLTSRESTQAPSEMTDLDTEDPASAHQSLLLTNEKGDEINNPPWQEVERIVRELNPGHFNSYASLLLPGNTYVQCLHGFNGWHVEWRITDPSGDYAHFRAGYPGGSSKAVELKKHDFVSEGEFRDLLHLDDVLDALRAFHQDQGLPGFLEWRRFDV